MSDKLETHTYDGKLRTYRALVAADLERARFTDPARKQRACAELRAALARTPAATPHTLRYFDDICAVAEWNAPRRRTSPNYDPSNDLWADDLLFLCYELYRRDSHRRPRDRSDILRTLAEQLHDMSTGPCPPGRTTRLFQTYTACL